MNDELFEKMAQCACHFYEKAKYHPMVMHGTKDGVPGPVLFFMDPDEGRKAAESGLLTNLLLENGCNGYVWIAEAWMREVNVLRPRDRLMPSEAPDRIEVLQLLARFPCGKVRARTYEIDRGKVLHERTLDQGTEHKSWMLEVALP